MRADAHTEPEANTPALAPFIGDASGADLSDLPQRTASPARTPATPTDANAGANSPRQPSPTGSSAAAEHEPVSVQEPVLVQEAPLSDVPQQNRPVTRLQRGIHKAKSYTDGIVRYACLIESGEPSSLEEALADNKWKHAMDEEYNALMKNKTWHLVPMQANKNVIDCKWVYKIKRKADGSIDRYRPMAV